MSGFRHRMPRLAGIVVGALTALPLLFGLGAPSVAHADESDCVGTTFAGGGFELFRLEDRFVPPPLRGFAFDCAARLTTVGEADGDLAQSQYALLFVDATPAEFAAMIRAFEAAGWIDDPAVNFVDAAGTRDSGQVDADAFAAIVDPQWATSRFSDANTGNHIVAITYTDGTNTSNDVALEVPSILVTTSISAPFAPATGLADPSVLSRLRTVADAIPTPTQTAVIAGGAVVLMLVVGWPSALLNSVVGSRYQSFAAWVQRRVRRGAVLQPTAERPGSRLPGWLMWPGFAAAAVIGAFVDPDFGLNPMSARVMLMLFLSFVLFNLATWAVVRRIVVRIQPDATPYLRFRWGTLLIVALAVLIARLLTLEPGIVFGLVAGIAFATALRASGSAAVVLAGSGFGLALALVAWVGYSLLAPIAAGAPGILPLVLGVEFLSAVTVKGVSSLPLALLPLGTLEGAKLLRWKRWVWAGAYAVGLAAFMLVLLTIPRSWGEVPGDFVRWLLLFGAYGAFAVVVWAINSRIVAKRPPKHVTPGEQPDAITLD